MHNQEEQDLLRYGEILTDNYFYEFERFIRIRTIAYNDHVYYMKMVDGEVIEVKELM